ncbi:hypothetical protein CRYUN_Cryun22dG0109100 [Craigia yunnanensis]
MIILIRYLALVKVQVSNNSRLTFTSHLNRFIFNHFLHLVLKVICFIGEELVQIAVRLYTCKCITFCMQFKVRHSRREWLN